VASPSQPPPEDDDLELIVSPASGSPQVWEPWDDPSLIVACCGGEPSSPLFALTLDALQDMIGHGSVETNREVGGILIGQFVDTRRGPATRVDDIIIADTAEASLTHVTFTHESWSQVHRQLDRRDDGARIVGWYHTHPGFGPFLSGQDLFIQTNFFNDPRHLALVLDPIQHLVATFGWREGAIVRTAGCYVFASTKQGEELRALLQTLHYQGEAERESLWTLRDHRRSR
jgi:proteasome lid subunit RPN8/RPN11